MSNSVAGSILKSRPVTSAENRPSSWSCVCGFGPHRRRLGDVGGQFLEQRRPLRAGAADDFVAGALAADVVVGRDRGQHRDAGVLGEDLGLAGAVVAVDHHAGHADVAAELAEVLDRAADVVGDVERLQVVAGDDDDLLAHVARDRQAEAAADHVAQEVEQHEVEAPVVEAELFQRLEAVDDAAPAAAAADLGAAEFHRVDAVALEADVADGHRLAGQLLLAAGLDDGRAGLAAEQQAGGVALRVAADQQHLLALLRHHVAQVGQREALADAALAVDGDDLRGLGGRARWPPDRVRWRLRRADCTSRRIWIGAPRGAVVSAHAQCLQSRTIFRQAAIAEGGAVGARRHARLRRGG